MSQPAPIRVRVRGRARRLDAALHANTPAEATLRIDDCDNPEFWAEVLLRREELTSLLQQMDSLCLTDQGQAAPKAAASLTEQAEQDRMRKIGEIRDDIESLYEAGRFEIAREIMGGVDRFNFSGVSEKIINRICVELSARLKGDPHV